MTTLNTTEVLDHISKKWDDSIVPALVEYIKIPNQSPDFDKEIHTNGFQEQVVELMIKWVKAQNIPGLTVEVHHEKGRTPLIYLELPATRPEAGTVLMYGHMDKQPPFTGWEEGLGPYTPVIKDKDGEPWLYGRGGADDGYAIFASVAAIQELQRQNIPHGRIVVVIEGSEESGSKDLVYYIDKLKERIGSPNFIVCLDSGAQNYKQLWTTTSLRGVLILELKVSLIYEGIHSGSGSGVVADSFRVCRELLSRIEDEKTGHIVAPFLHCEIPEQRKQQAHATGNVLGETLFKSLPFNSGVKPMVENYGEFLLNKTWRPTLTITGVDGIPPVASGGNVLRPFTTLKLSVRIPPRVDGDKAEQQLIELLTKNPPYNAKVEVVGRGAGNGWDAPPLSQWLESSLQTASSTYFKQDACFVGEGGSIPFMGMLGQKFPKAQFFITGVLGPNSNAHGPNEGLNIPFAKKVNSCVVSVLADHGKQNDS